MKNLNMTVMRGPQRRADNQINLIIIVFIIFTMFIMFIMSHEESDHDYSEEPAEATGKLITIAVMMAMIDITIIMIVIILTILKRRKKMTN